MHRIDGPGATVDNKFTEGDPVNAVPATDVTDDWANAVQEEISAVIESAGLTLNKADNTQLLQAIQGLPGKVLVKSVAGGSNATLTTAEARYPIILLTGALTANINVVVPAAGRSWIVANNTSGAFTLTFKTAAGSGVGVPQGSTLALYCDGVSVFQVGAQANDAPGTMSIHAGNTPPAGKLKANGAAVSRSAYSALFAALVTAAGFTPQAVTMTIASPAVFTKAAHGLYPGARVRLATTGTLPTGLDTSTDYFVETIDANTFYLSATLMGARIATTGTQAGTHTFLQSWFGLGDGSTTFNLPDMRGEGIRGFDDGRGVDAARGFGSAQLDALQNITGSIIAYSSASGAFAIGGGAGNSQGGGAALSVISFDASRVARTSTETRGRNLALLICIKY